MERPETQAAAPWTNGDSSPSPPSAKDRVVCTHWLSLTVLPKMASKVFRRTWSASGSTSWYKAAWVARILAEMQAQPQPEKTFWNINLPHLPPGEDELTPRVPSHPARSPLNVSYIQDGTGYVYSASYASRPRDPGSDVEACFGGNVAVSLLHV